MTFATKITVARIVLVPVFAALAVAYGLSVQRGAPDEALRWWALGVFVAAAGSDGIDGWIARRFNQRSELGAILDPIADKSLLLVSIVTLTFVDWGPNGWHIPLWFTALVFARDTLILCGVRYLWNRHKKVHIRPTWISKGCTVAQMFTVGWVMLKIVPFPPLYPCLLAAVFTVWSGIDYFRVGWRCLKAQA